MNSVFEELDNRVGLKQIKPGSLEEKFYLERKAITACKNFCNANLIAAPCDIQVITNKYDPEQIVIKLDSETTEKLKQRGLYE